MKDIFEHALKLYYIIGNCKLLTIFQICSHSKISQSNNIILKSTLFVTRWNIFFDNSKIVLFFFVFVLKSTIQSKPVDTGRKLNVHKTFRRRPGRLLNVLCTFSLRPVSTGNILNGKCKTKNLNFTLGYFSSIYLSESDLMVVLSRHLYNLISKFYTCTTWNLYLYSKVTYFMLHSHTLIFITFAKHDFRGFFILVVCVFFLHIHIS